MNYIIQLHYKTNINKSSLLGYQPFNWALYGQNKMNLGEVVPREGIGQIKLGTERMSILELIGPPIRESIKRHNRTGLVYDGFNLTFDENSILESIEVYPKTNIKYKGLEIFKSNDAWQQLIIDDGNPFHLVGTIILLNLGVSMWEDPHEEEQNKSFVISVDGTWDRLKSKLKPYEV